MSRVAQLKKMLEGEPNDAFLHFALAMEYAKQGLGAEAVTEFKKVKQINPQYMPAYFQQGNALIALGAIEAAKQVLAQGITVAQQVGDRHAATQMGEALALLNARASS